MTTTPTRIASTIPVTEDSRTMCFRQVAHPAEPDPRMDETGVLCSA